MILHQNFALLRAEARSASQLAATDALPSLRSELAPSMDSLLGDLRLLADQIRVMSDARSLESVASLQHAAQRLVALVDAAVDAAPPSGVQARPMEANDNARTSLTPGELCAPAVLESRFVRKTFGRYLGEEIATRLLDTPQGLRLGGEKREVTLLMSDFRGFTSLTEGMDPEEMMRLLNHYLGEMTEIIVQFKGTLVEFIGDAIFVLFGAPSPLEDHAGRAIACALAMQAAMERVNAAARAVNLPSLEMGIAVHTGEVVVGNIGSEVRSKYGAVGSPVNLASRIQSHAAGGHVLVSEAAHVASGCELDIATTEVMQAKGFTERVTVHDVRAIGRSKAMRRSCGGSV